MIALFDDVSLLVPAGIILVLAGLYRFIIHPVLISSLSKIPNIHPLAAITPLWMLWVRFQDKENNTVLEGHRKHGPVIRLGPNEVSVNCVDDGIKTVYGRGFEKTPYYSFFANFGFADS